MGVETGSDVEEKLIEGQKIDEIFKTLSVGANVTVKDHLIKPPSGFWSDVIKNNILLSRLLVTQDKKHKQIQECIPVYRQWGGMGFDVFYLFFDENKTLVGYWMEHFN